MTFHEELLECLRRQGIVKTLKEYKANFNRLIKQNNTLTTIQKKQVTKNFNKYAPAFYRLVKSRGGV